MTKLERAIAAIVEVFEEYAGKDEDKKKLSNAELAELIKCQMTSPEFKVETKEKHLTAQCIQNLKHRACIVQYTTSMKLRFRFSFTLCRACV